MNHKNLVWKFPKKNTQKKNWLKSPPLLPLGELGDDDEDLESLSGSVPGQEGGVGREAEVPLPDPDLLIMNENTNIEELEELFEKNNKLHGLEQFTDQADVGVGASDNEEVIYPKGSNNPGESEDSPTPLNTEDPKNKELTSVGNSENPGQQLEFTDDAQERIAQNKARVEFLNKAEQEGQLSEIYGYNSNFQELAEREITSLKAEIRELENNSRAFKNESSSPVPGIPRYALERKLKKEELESNSEQAEEVPETTDETRETETEKTSDDDKQPPKSQEVDVDFGEDVDVTQEGQEGKRRLERREQREDFRNPPIENWRDLYQAIWEVGRIESSKQVFEPEDNIELVVRVRLGENPILLTRTKGLRRAVLLLLASEAGEEAVQQGQQEQGEGPEEPGVEETEMEATNPDAVPVPVPETLPEAILEGQPETVNENRENAIDAEFRVIESENGEGHEEGGEEETEPGVGEDVGNAAREAFENANGQNSLEREREKRGRHWWNWLKERAKGLFTFGFWEVHQAEKVRMAGKKAEKEILQGAGYMKKEGVMEETDIELIKTRLRESGNDVDNMSEEQLHETYQWLSEAVTERKVIANQQIEDEIVERSIAEIEKRMSGYRKYDGEKIEMTPDKKLSPEKRAEIEQKIRGALAAVRQGQVERDMIKFSKIVRSSLDKSWYKRYVASGIEAALGFAGIKWLVVPMIDSYTKAKATEAALQTRRVISAVENAVSSGSPIGDVGSTAVEATEATRGLQDNLWNMAKGLLKEKGLGNPTDGQIMEVTKQLAADNSVGVNKWGMAGNILDTKMPVGMAIKVGGAALKAASLAKIAVGL